MDGRILIGLVLALIVLAFGGFFAALGPPLRSSRPAIPPVAQVPAPANPAPNAAALTPPITAETVDAEIALSEHADVQALLKQSFTADYARLLDEAVVRRRAGVSEQAMAHDLAEGFQTLMRNKLRFGVAASMATVDKLAANEASLFHALGTEGAAFCLRMLGKDDTPAPGSPPPSVNRLMQQGTVLRFQAIAEGVSSAQTPAALTADEMRAFEASLAREGLTYRDVSSGAYLKPGTTPGKPCLTLESLHTAIARLPDAARRKIYAGMFFLGRDR